MKTSMVCCSFLRLDCGFVNLKVDACQDRSTQWKIQEILYVDDVILIADGEAELQLLCDNFSLPAGIFKVTKSLKKYFVMLQGPDQFPEI